MTKQRMYEIDLGDGGSTSIWAADLAEAIERAEAWVREGDYDFSPGDGTVWIDAIVTLCDADGNVLEDADGEPLEEEHITVAVDPPVPDCMGGHRHKWVNERVRSHGGSAIVSYTCQWCGVIKEDDGWAQRPDTGQQGLDAIRYSEPSDERVIALRTINIEIAIPETDAPVDEAFREFCFDRWPGASVDIQVDAERKQAEVKVTVIITVDDEDDMEDTDMAEKITEEINDWLED